MRHVDVSETHVGASVLVALPGAAGVERSGAQRVVEHILVHR